MTGHREARLNEQLKREISAIVARKVRDPRVENLLVTDVRVTPDLWVARVFVRPLGGDVDEILAGLETAAPFIRRELGKVLRIRRIPELRFFHDQTLDSALRIEEVLREISRERDDGEEEAHGKGEGTGSGEVEG